MEYEGWEEKTMLRNRFGILRLLCWYALRASVIKSVVIKDVNIELGFFPAFSLTEHMKTPDCIFIFVYVLKADCTQAKERWAWRLKPFPIYPDVYFKDSLAQSR